jgi:hypothetical protein
MAPRWALTLRNTVIVFFIFDCLIIDLIKVLDAFFPDSGRKSFTAWARHKNYTYYPIHVWGMELLLIYVDVLSAPLPQIGTNWIDAIRALGVPVLGT